MVSIYKAVFSGVATKSRMIEILIVISDEKPSTPKGYRLIQSGLNKDGLWIGQYYKHINKRGVFSDFGERVKKAFGIRDVIKFESYHVDNHI